MTDVTFDLRVGGGSAPEVMYGYVDYWGLTYHESGTATILPSPTRVDIVDGQGTATALVPTPNDESWLYVFEIHDSVNGKAYTFICTVPDTASTAFTALEVRKAPTSGGNVTVTTHGASHEWGGDDQLTIDPRQMGDPAFYAGHVDDAPSGTVFVPGNAGSPANGYPYDGEYLLTTYRPAGTRWHQRAVRVGANYQRTFWRSMFGNPPWGVWVETPLLEVDTSAGLVVDSNMHGGTNFLYGDTGWRNLAADLDPTNWTESSSGSVIFNVRRSNNVVELQIGGIKGSLGSAFGPSLPAGFLPQGNITLPMEVGQGITSPLLASIRVNAGGALHGTPLNYSACAGTVSFLTNNPWPTTLPGTAVAPPVNP